MQGGEQVVGDREPVAGGDVVGADVGAQDLVRGLGARVECGCGFDVAAYLQAQLLGVGGRDDRGDPLPRARAQDPAARFDTAPGQHVGDQPDGLQFVTDLGDVTVRLWDVSGLAWKRLGGLGLHHALDLQGLVCSRYGHGATVAL
ncbi:hypothetical protein [Streptosporangium sp. LJ11]|uniref:hypothetical protein n=1 Tax=Streptosporangium sp. LJ11 TaxID=3436927 RepID=UPI003F792C31